LLQALALGLASVDRDQALELVGRSERSDEEHPFVRETAALIGRALEAGKGLDPLIERDIWFEDAEALDDGGFNLSPEAHRVLALSTLLINLAERRFRDWRDGVPGATESAVGRREDAFTGAKLPKCFVRSSHAATMFQAACDCPF